MRKILFILSLAMLCTASTFAQKKKVRKVEKIYLQGEFVECIETADKILKRKNQLTDIYLFKSLSNFKLSISEEDPIKHYQRMRWALRYAAIYKSNTKGNDFPSLHKREMELLKEEAQDFSKLLSSSDRKRESAQINKYLSLAFGKDAVPPSLFKEKEIVVETTTPDEEEAPANKNLITGKDIVDYSKKLVGAPYKYGGMDKKGFDCSGFTAYVYSQFGIELPHNSTSQSELGERLPFTKAQPGDLVFFGSKSGKKYRIQHVALYNEDKGKMEVIHSVSGGVSVEDQESSSWNHYWKDRVLFVNRVLPLH